VTTALQTLLVVCYPLAVYVALDFASPRVVALGALAVVAARVAFLRRGRFAALARALAPVGLAIALPSVATLLFDDPVSLLLAPALVNAALLAVFTGSFARRETVVEALARAQVGELDAEERAYCRRVTIVWCAFFAANGTASALLALEASRAVWALYTGVIAYALMGALFATEYVYRHWRFRRYVGAPTDAVLKRLFPPRS
jgi:uncharacterized membrane protein